MALVLRLAKTVGKVAVSVIGVAVVGGCFVYVPVETGVPERGTEVRLQLMPSQEYDLGDMRIRDVTRVEGVMFGDDPDTVAIWSKWMYTAGGNRYWSENQVLYFTSDDLRSLQKRVWHPAKTIVAVGVGTAVGLGMMRIALEVTDPDGDKGGAGGGTTTYSFVPLNPMSR